MKQTLYVNMPYPCSQSMWRIKYYPQQGGVVLVTDIENIGMSPTNAMEVIVGYIRHQGCQFEHVWEYLQGTPVPAGQRCDRLRGHESFDRVEVDWSHVTRYHMLSFPVPQVQWRPGTRQQFEQLIGERV